MSIKLMSVILDSVLPSDEKFVAIVLADYASDDGARIFPSQATIARKVSRTDRAVRGTLRKLEEKGILERVAGHGAGSIDNRRGTEYRLHADRLPGLNPEIFDRFVATDKPEVRDDKPEVRDRQTGSPTSDDPSRSMKRSTTRGRASVSLIHGKGRRNVGDDFSHLDD